MKSIRIPEGTWRPDGRLFHFGTYRVPEDMPEDLARRAVDEGVAVVVEEADVVQAAPVAAPPASPARAARRRSLAAR